MAPGQRFPCAKCGGSVAAPGQAIVAALGRGRSRVLLPAILLAAAGAAVLLASGGSGGGPAAPRTPDDAAPPDRERWWDGAVTRPSGAERLLAPRELLRLLEDGRRRGFDADAAWWRERERFVGERVLEVDPDDAAANRGAGRHVLQDHPGFKALWERILATRTTHPAIDELIERYDYRLQEDRPLFLDDEESARAAALLEDARAHLDRVDADPAYAGLQSALQKVRADGALHVLPHVIVEARPFLVFYAARDLARIPGEDAKAEEVRIETLKAKYRVALEPVKHALEGMTADVRASFPELCKAHPLGPGDLFVQWIFADEGLYDDFRDRTFARDARAPGRVGHLRRKDVMAFLFQPVVAEATQGGTDGAPHPGDAAARPDPLAETAAYLGAWQILFHWSTDAKSPSTRHLDTSRALWLHEGWASWLAARRVGRSTAGDVVRAARALLRPLPPPIVRVVERESWYELASYAEPIEMDPNKNDPLPLTVREGFSDLSWLLTDVCLEGDRRAGYLRFFLAQIEGRRGEGFEFEDCLGVAGQGDWAALDAAVVARIDALE